MTDALCPVCGAYWDCGCEKPPMRFGVSAMDAFVTRTRDAMNKGLTFAHEYQAFRVGRTLGFDSGRSPLLSPGHGDTPEWHSYVDRVADFMNLDDAGRAAYEAGYRFGQSSTQNT